MPKRPFAGPEQVLAYLSRYTHRVAIANSRLVELTDEHVVFRWKDYRAKGRTKAKVMRLSPAEFMRRFLMHVLPDGFHRIRHYGLLANGHRAENLARCRALLGEVAREADRESAAEAKPSNGSADPQRCPCCGGRMVIIESFEGVFRSRGAQAERIRQLMTAQAFSKTIIAASARLAATGFARPREDSALSRGRDEARMTLHSGPIATAPTFVASVGSAVCPRDNRVSSAARRPAGA